ncbi:hypothetical protein [uncultured Thiothrix sp.]|uniref:hypothetical protein n=1 Tax=uncultured Thiothrix sp. TaxID=223185 RepID=UPI00260CE3CB|nr:hypothetical protein [uncultured Thiothrix sp.]
MRYLILAVLLCLSFPSWADDPAIEKIRQTYNQIHSSLNSLKRSEFESGWQSTEGVEAVKYQDRQGKVNLIKVTAFGEMGKTMSEYYYQNQQVIFALEITKNYNTPMYIDDKKAKELGIEPYDPKKTTTTENRYYFKQHKMIRWLEGSQSIKASDTRFNKEASRIVSDSQKLFKLAQD